MLANVAMAPVGGLVALLLTGTHFSVSSGVGFLALFGVSVQTGIIMLEYINQMRSTGLSVREAAIEGAVLRLRPIMMTMLVATLGLLPAATFAWDWVGLAKAVCDCDCGRAGGGAADQRVSAADAVCVDRARYGRAAEGGRRVRALKTFCMRRCEQGRALLVAAALVLPGPGWRWGRRAAAGLVRVLEVRVRERRGGGSRLRRERLGMRAAPGATTGQTGQAAGAQTTGQSAAARMLRGECWAGSAQAAAGGAGGV